MLTEFTWPAAFISFSIGCVAPVLNFQLKLWIQLIRGVATKASVTVTVIAFVVSRGLCSIGLIYMSTVQVGESPPLVVAFLSGVGLVRWLRREI